MKCSFWILSITLIEPSIVGLMKFISVISFFLLLIQLKRQAENKALKAVKSIR